MTSSASVHSRRKRALPKVRHAPRFFPKLKLRLALEIAVLLLSFMSALVGSYHWVTPAWSLLAFANYIWLCTLMLRLEPRGTIIILPQLIKIASSMVSLVMIEHGGEMFELGLVGRPGPWSNQLNVCNLLFCTGALLAIRPLLQYLDRSPKSTLASVNDRYANLLAGLLLFVTALTALAMIIRGLQFGFPLLSGIDRFEFRRFSADKVTLYALNFKFVFAYALGIVAFIIPASRWLRTFAILVYSGLMVLYFLFGDKFFTQLAALAAFLTPYAYHHYRELGRRLWIYAVAGVMALTSVMAVTVFIYSNGFTETSAATVKRLSGRMVGQGELWFLQSSIGAPLVDWNRELLDRYASSLSVKSVDIFAVQNSLGPSYFSNRYAPGKIRASLQRKAGTVTYTAVTEAMGLVLFGWVGLGLMMITLGGLLGLAGAYIAYAIKRRSVLSGVFAAYIYHQLRSSIIQATPWVVGSIYSARWLAIIMMTELTLLVLASGGKSSSIDHARPAWRLR
jgi:hypothetical protein